MYILIILKKVGYSWEYPGIQLTPPMPRNGLLEFVDLSDTLLHDGPLLHFSLKYLIDCCVLIFLKSI